MDKTSKKAFEITKFVLLFLLLLIFLPSCSPGQHSGHIYIRDPNHVEVVFDRPMSMEMERDGVKIKASSLKPGFFEEIIKFMLLRPN